MTRLLRVGVFCLLLAAVANGPAAARTAGAAAVEAPKGSAATTVRLVVRTGQRAPGGGTFVEFSDPTINGRGDMVFGALTRGARVHEAMYLRSGDRLRVLVTAGSPAPTGGVFRGFSDMLLNDQGTAGFLGRTTSRAAPEGLYLAQGGTITAVAAVGQQAPSGGTFTDFANPAMNNQGVIAFVGRTTGAGAEGIFTSSEGTVTPALMAGQPAPSGGVFQFFLDGTPALNDRGHMAFVASTTERHTQGVYVLLDGRPVTVVTTDDEAPVGGKFTEFGSVVITNAGTVGFIGRTGHSRVREALYVTGRATLVPLARYGEDAAGGVLTTFGIAVINASEQMVFELSLPIIPQAVYLATRSGVQPIVKAGDPAPGGGRFTRFSAPTLNDSGQVALVAETDDGHHGVYLVRLR